MKLMVNKLLLRALAPLEQGDEAFEYKASHRKILIGIGLLFLAISLGSLWLTIKFSEPGGIIPILVFLGVGLVCEVVGMCGSDRAVARIWKSK